MSNKECVIICGGSYGLGSEISKFFISRKAKVIILSRNKNKFLDFKRKVNYKNIEYFRCDLAKISDVNKIFDKIKKNKNIINYLICNAGTGKKNYILNKNYENYSLAFSQNFLTAKNPIEVLVNKKNYRKLKIIAIASVAGYFRGNAPLPYSLAKNALINYVKEISSKLAEKNIRINSISPGHIYQKNNNWYKKVKTNKKKVNRFIKDNVALKRFCSPYDIINMIGFLLSKENDYITGIDIKIDGNTK